MDEDLNSDKRENPMYQEWITKLGEAETASETSPSPEDKERNLKFENLENLSTEKYLELWRHLNPFYVAHITRQGVRDHVGMLYHSSGIGQFQDGYKEIIQNDKLLRSPAEIRYGLPPDFTKDDVASALDKMLPPSAEPNDTTPQEILQSLPLNRSGASAEPWGDKRAIHFEQNTVLDDIYGAESGNEIFFVFPTDVIASQSKFGGHIGRGLNYADSSFDGRKWNDLFVWPEDGRVPIDAGLTFLPKSQMVDRSTGSKYATKEIVDSSGNSKLVPEKDEARIERFKNWVKGLTKNSPEMIQALEGDDDSGIENKLKEIGIPEDATRDINVYKLLESAENGYFSDALDLSEEEMAKMSKEELFDVTAREYLAKRNADLKLAENPITAEEYWENYFSKNPDQKPAHVIYYDGDPSRAVAQLLADNGIAEKKTEHVYAGGNFKTKEVITGPSDTSKRDGAMLGFDNHFIGHGEDDKRLTADHQRFNELALEILQERLDSSHEQTAQ